MLAAICPDSSRGEYCRCMVPGPWVIVETPPDMELKPPQLPGFNNRLSANWKLPLQIAQHAGGGWREQARRSAIYLSRTPYEPSMGVQLLAALRAMFAKNRTQITSEQVVQELLADPDSQWHEYRGRGPVTKNQVAALLKDFEIRPVVVHPTKRADVRLQGGAIRGRVCAFLATRTEHPNTQAWGRRKGVKVFGCSDDCARWGTAKVDRMPTNE